MLVFYNLQPRNHRGWASLNGQKAAIALVELGVPFDDRREDRYNKSQEFQDTHHKAWPDPEKKVTTPTIVDTDGTTLTESAVVIEYLDAKYGKNGHQLVPADAKQAAVARLFYAVVQSTTGTFTKFARAEKEEQIGQQRKSFLHGITVLDKFLQIHGSPGGPFLLGAQFSFAEVMSASAVQISGLVLKAVHGFDPIPEAKAAGATRFAEWAQAVLDRPSVKETSQHDPKQISKESWLDWVKEMPGVGL